MANYVGNKFGQQDVEKLRDFEKRVDPNDKNAQALLEEMRQHVKKLEDMRKNEDPRLSFSTPEFKEAQRIFTDGFKKNFGKPVDWALVKDHPWSTPQLRKLDQPVDVHGKPWPLDASGNPIFKLILMRHAESEETAQSGRDHDRAITPQGTKDAQAIAKALESKGWVPSVAVCSNALRTRQTFESMCTTFPSLEQADAHFLGSLYTAAALDGETRDVLQALVAAEAGYPPSSSSSSSSSHHCVLCLGHNRGWEEAASSFAGRDIELGHCHAALLELSGVASWEEAFHDKGGEMMVVESKTWTLVDVLVP